VIQVDPVYHISTGLTLIQVDPVCHISTELTVILAETEIEDDEKYLFSVIQVSLLDHYSL